MAARRPTAIRLSVEERDALRAKAAACGMSASAWCRSVSLGGTPRCTAGEATVRQLKMIGHNLNQLAKLAHQGQLGPDAAEELRQLRASLDLLLRVMW